MSKKVRIRTNFRKNYTCTYGHITMLRQRGKVIPIIAGVVPAELIPTNWAQQFAIHNGPGVCTPFFLRVQGQKRSTALRTRIGRGAGGNQILKPRMGRIRVAGPSEAVLPSGRDAGWFSSIEEDLARHRPGREKRRPRDL